MSVSPHSSCLSHLTLLVCVTSLFLSVSPHSSCLCHLTLLVCLTSLFLSVSPHSSCLCHLTLLVCVTSLFLSVSPHSSCLCQRDQQLYIHLALHLLCLLISSLQCRSHRRLDFFYSNTNNLVQLEDTAIKTERCCSMQCTERMRAVHHSIDFYLYFKSNIVFGVIIDNQISPRD